MHDGPWAHSKNERGERDPLVTHLRDTAERAREFAAAFGAEDLAGWLGLWHDAGKFHPDWQDYLLRAEAWDAGGRKSPRPKSTDHKAAGVHLAFEAGAALYAFALEGHHGGMKGLSWTRDVPHDPVRGPVASRALTLARTAVPDLAPGGAIPLPAFMQGAPAEAYELFVRMLFSALVDADFLDTEEHFHPDRAGVRGSDVTLADLWERLVADEAAQRAAGRRPPGLVNDVRNEVLEACLAAAAQQPGFFRLTVPTGGGKTRSGMAFALRHALAHGLRRVIVAVPFITIAKQTSDTLASAFDSPVPDDVTGELARVFPATALIQHYTGGLEDDADYRRKLAAENWDAPIVVTSTVQLFESLFANRPSACRKLHRVARSVIILDEAQSLPPGLIEPILDVLRALVRDYGASIVFSTATQPAFETIRGFGELNAREIVPQHPAHFEALRRVRYTHVADPLPWDAVAARMLAAPAALAIVNTRKHAAELFDAVREQAPAGSVFHLSTRMVQRHRQEVLDEVRQRLQDGLPCYLVSTAVVEAGVDLSFPRVLRALAPLDAIVQAAGRCNRHGELGVEGGELVIFEPVDAAMPPGPYRTGAGIMQGVLASGEDIFALATQFDYSRRFFDNLDKDGPNIQELRRSFDYPQVAKDFAMIEPTASVVVPATDPSGRAAEVLGLVASRQATRADMRALHPFMVSLPRREFDRLVTSGVVREVAAGLGEWLGAYGDAGIAV